MDYSKIVIIKTFDNEQQASIAKGLLDSSNINSTLIHQTIQSVLPLHTGMTGIELCVAPEDEALARKILEADFDKEEYRKATNTSAGKPRSCSCKKKL